MYNLKYVITVYHDISTRGLKNLKQIIKQNTGQLEENCSLEHGRSNLSIYRQPEPPSSEKFRLVSVGFEAELIVESETEVLSVDLI